jgi:hypothetical protein
LMFLLFASRECVELNTALRSRGHQAVMDSFCAAHKRQQLPADDRSGA